MTKEIEELLKINETIITSEQCEEHRTLKNDEKVLLMNNMKIKDYIQQLELSVEALEMEHNHDVAMINEAKGNAVKWSKERDNLKVILDKVTDKLKETIKKERQLMPYLPHKSVSFHYANGRKVLAKEILIIIEGEKK